MLHPFRLTSRLAMLLVLSTARLVYMSLESFKDQSDAGAIQSLNCYLPYHFSKQLLACSLVI